ncbi:MAG: AsmA family protein [Vicinamibacterales bacterium]
MRYPHGMRRILLLILVGVLVLAALAAAAAYRFLGSDSLRQALAQQATRYLGQPVQIGAAQASLLPRPAVHLTDVRIGDPVRIELAAVDVSTGLRGLLGGRIVDAELRVLDSTISLPLDLSLGTAPGGPDDRSGPGGPVADPGSVPGAEPDAGNVGPNAGPDGISPAVESVRALSLRNVRVTSRGRSVEFDLDSSLADDVATIDRLSVTADRTSLVATGTVSLADARRADLDVEADTLDLDDLAALAAAFAPEADGGAVGSADGARGASRTRSASGDSGGAPATPGTASAADGIVIDARVHATSATAGGVPVEDLNTTLTATAGEVSASPLSFDVFGGRFEGEFDLRLGDDLGLQLEANLTGLDVAQLAAFGDADGTVTGRLDATGTFEGRGRDFEGVLTSATGDATVAIVDGTIRRLNLIRTIVLFFGRPEADAPAGTEAFQRIDARIRVADGVATADALTMTSPDVDLEAEGTLDLGTKALAGRARLLLSQSLSAQAGTDLRRYTLEGDRIVLPATIGGTLGDPSVGIDARAAVGRALTNELRRRLGGVLERLRQPQSAPEPPPTP